MISKQLNIFDFDFGPKTIAYSFFNSFFQKNLKLIVFYDCLLQIELPSFDQNLTCFENRENRSWVPTKNDLIAQNRA